MFYGWKAHSPADRNMGVLHLVEIEKFSHYVAMYIFLTEIKIHNF